MAFGLGVQGFRGLGLGFRGLGFRVWGQDVGSLGLVFLCLSGGGFIAFGLLALGFRA